MRWVRSSFAAPSRSGARGGRWGSGGEREEDGPRKVVGSWAGGGERRGSFPPRPFGPGPLSRAALCPQDASGARDDERAAAEDGGDRHRQGAQRPAGLQRGTERGHLGLGGRAGRDAMPAGSGRLTWPESPRGPSASSGRERM